MIKESQIIKKERDLLVVGCSHFSSIDDFLSGKNISTFSFSSGSSQMAWVILQNNYLSMCHVNLVKDHIYASFFEHTNKKLIRSKAVRLRWEEKRRVILFEFDNIVRRSKAKSLRRQEREARRAGFIRVLGQGSVTLAFFFFVSKPAFASDFQNNLMGLEPTLQEKKGLVVKKVAILTLGILAVGVVGYVVSSRAVPYFIRLAPGLKKDLVSPILNILPTAALTTTGIDVIKGKGREFLRVPYFLTSPFSSDLTTISQRVSEAIEFLGKVNADPLFSLTKHKHESYNIMLLMDRHIDSLTALVVDNKEQLRLHSGKIILLNEAYQRLCTDNIRICLRILLSKAPE